MSPRTNLDELKMKRVVPGPGAYQPKESPKQNFSFSFGLKTQSNFFDKNAKFVPGPG